MLFSGLDKPVRRLDSLVGLIRSDIRKGLAVGFPRRGLRGRENIADFVGDLFSSAEVIAKANDAGVGERGVSSQLEGRPG